MKKWIAHLAIATLAAPLTIQAGSQAFTGFVGGVNVGIIQSEAKLNQWSEFQFQTNNIQTIAWNVGAPTKLSDTSGTVGFNLGFAQSFNPCVNWGIELRANFMSLDNSLDESLGGSQFFSLTRHTSVKLTQQYAAIAKLAYLFKCDSQFYIFLGPQWGNFKLKSYQNVSTTIQDQPLSGSTKTEHENYRAGWYWGLGLEQLLNKCTSIGLEYNYADYGHLNFDKYLRGDVFLNTTPVANSYLDKYHNMHMTINTFLLKVNYYFG